MKFLVAIIALSGHLAIGTILINRLHSTALPHWLLKLIDLLWILWHAITPLVWFVWMRDPSTLSDYGGLSTLVYFHLVVCAAAAVSLIPGWLTRQLTRQTSSLQLSNDTKVIDVTQILGHRPIHSRLGKLLIRIPRNEILQLHVNEKVLAIPRLHPALDGLTITHFSDLHYTGALTEAFHHEVVRQANALESDLIAVTGDIIDKRTCMHWLGDILGQLKAKHGTYFILGNHDLRIRDEFGIRNALTTQGLVDLGRRWTQITIGGQPVILAGNELPWFSPAADLAEAPGPPDTLRILLSHAPDQFLWARQNDIDLMLAGHTHGGQVQLPLLGPVLSPSRYGVRYAGGTFYQKPTLMHVSRGISGTRHLRINAAPELTKLILVRPESRRIENATF